MGKEFVVDNLDDMCALMCDNVIPEKIMDIDHCPECGHKTKVIDSRNYKTGRYRRRKCLKCGYRYTTWETMRRDFNKRDFEMIDTLINDLVEIRNRMREYEEVDV